MNTNQLLFVGDNITLTSSAALVHQIPASRVGRITYVQVTSSRVIRYRACFDGVDVELDAEDCEYVPVFPF